MGVLLLRFSGPLQSWGDSSRFTTRGTRRMPTKSGVVGLLAAALGRTRGESVADLATLELGVRADQPGRVVRDFQTERSLDGRAVMPLTNRLYLADAKFLVALGGPDDELAGIELALRAPRWPLYLGRRSCPADQPILLGLAGDRYDDVREALRSEPWLAADWYRRRYPTTSELEAACDARDGEVCESHADVPLSFGSDRRYMCRPVTRFFVANPDYSTLETASDEGGSDVRDDTLRRLQETHDPMGCL